MAALNRIQSPSAIGHPPFHVGVCGSSWKACCCSVSAALASVGLASGSPAKPHFSQPNGEGVLLLCWLKSGIFVERDTVQVDGIDGVGVIAQSTCVPMSRQTVQNRCVVCRSRRLRTPVVCGPRDADATSVAFQRIPGHDPGGQLRCTSGLPSAGLQHGTSVWSVILMRLFVAI